MINEKKLKNLIIKKILLNFYNHIIINIQITKNITFKHFNFHHFL